METPPAVRATQLIARAALFVQLALGILLWTGSFDRLRIFHIAVGIVLVATMWFAAALGLRRGAPVPQAVVAVVWSLLMPVFGLTQEGILAGSAHLLIQVLHLLVGFVAVGMVEGLARSPGRRAAHAAS